MYLMITLKVTTNQNFTVSLENTVLEKPERGRVRELAQIEPFLFAAFFPHPFLGSITCLFYTTTH